MLRNDNSNADRLVGLPRENSGFRSENRVVREELPKDNLGQRHPRLPLNVMTRFVVLEERFK